MNYAKAVICLLTFMGYIYSGYGSGVMEKLAFTVLESVFTDLIEKSETAKKIADNFYKLHDVLDAAIEEDCTFWCPTGDDPKPDKNHVPSANGCSLLSLEISKDFLPFPKMEKCCDAHDICYDTCNNEKEVCDKEFKRCLYKHCESLKSTGTATVCKGTAKILFIGTLALGCNSYTEAQTEACNCPPIPKNMNKKKIKYTSGGKRSEL